MLTTLQARVQAGLLAGAVRVAQAVVLLRLHPHRKPLPDFLPVIAFLETTDSYH